MSEQLPRRRRPPLSCTVCRRRKLKCDRCSPCAQCIKSKDPDNCTYTFYVAKDPGPEDSAPASAPASAPTVSDRPSTSISSGLHVFDSRNRVSKPTKQDDLGDLPGRVKALEYALSRTGSGGGRDLIHTPETMDGSGVVRPETGIGEDVLSLPQPCFRGRNDGTRYVGRSNYALTMWLFKEVGYVWRSKSLKKDESGIERLKTQVWSWERRGHQQAYREYAFRLGEMVPAKAVADQLLELYLSTFETTHRILHVPTFLRQYEAHWADPRNTDAVFVAKLLVAFAVSSSFYSSATKLDERDLLHEAAARWIMAVQSWATSVFVGSNINLDMLQIQCLLMIARQSDAMDGDVVSITSGSLTRSAMVMGLHRYPRRFSPMYPFWAEMRRRLWATIVELDLQSSADGGIQPSIDLDECDCEAPSNWDDADISEGMLFDPGPPEAGVATRSEFQALLTRSLPVRLRIARMVNSLKFTLSYDEALRLSDELIRCMDEGITLFDKESGQHNGFARAFYIFHMRRALLLLHRPFGVSALQHPKFTYSRKICLESSLEILSQLEGDRSYAHLGQLAGGMFRQDFFHAALTVCAEIRLQTEELSTAHRSTLADLVQSQQNVMLRAVERTIDALQSRLSGKGFKAFAFLSMVYASVKARLNNENALTAVEQVSSRVVAHCKEVMNVQDKLPSISNIPTPLPEPVMPDLSDLQALDFGTLFDLSGYGEGGMDLGVNNVNVGLLGPDSASL